MTEILTCKNLTKIYGRGDNRVVALNNVNLSVNRGEFVSVMGASGSGKSTLLHLLGAIDRPTDGTIIIDGTDLASLTPTGASLLRRRKVGLIYQFYNLIPTLTVKRNIMLPVLLDKKKPDPELFDRLTGLLGLKDRLDFLPSQLSGGQQQRTAIARSLLFGPAVLLADEPTGNLDQRNSREITDLLQQCCRELNQTILLITHDRHVALSADRIITLEDGEIQSDEAVIHESAARAVKPQSVRED